MNVLFCGVVRLVDTRGTQLGARFFVLSNKATSILRSDEQNAIKTQLKKQNITLFLFHTNERQIWPPN